MVCTNLTLQIPLFCGERSGIVFGILPSHLRLKKADLYFTGAGIINIPTERELLKLMDEIRNSRPNEQSA